MNREDIEKLGEEPLDAYERGLIRQELEEKEHRQWARQNATGMAKIIGYAGVFLVGLYAMRDAGLGIIKFLVTKSTGGGGE